MAGVWPNLSVPILIVARLGVSSSLTLSVLGPVGLTPTLKTKSFRIFEGRLRLDIARMNKAVQLFAIFLPLNTLCRQAHIDEPETTFEIGEPSDLDTSPR